MKKVIKKKPEVKVEVTEVVEEVKPQLAILTLDFAREDLNMLRDRVNELINRANAIQK